MKKYLLILILLVCPSLLFGCNVNKNNQDIKVSQKTESSSQENTVSKPAKEDEIVVLNWTDYIPESVFIKFQEKYGVKVRQVNFSSELEMQDKLKKEAGKFDVTVANGGLISVLIKNGQLQTINLKNIPNIKNIGKQYLDKPFDRENKYSVPFMTGYTGIIVNTDKVKKPITSYADLWDPQFKNKISFCDDMRSVIGATLKKLGYSANETDPKVLEKVRLEMRKLKKNVQAINSDATNRLVASGEASIGFLWTSEVVSNQVDNPKVKPALPKEGLIIFQDNFLIPKDAPHKELGEKFINFILDPETNAEITRVVPYATPNMAAYKYLDKSSLENKSIYLPIEEIEKAEHINSDISPTTEAIYKSIWEEFTKN